jgi:hypothetical protein
VRIKRSSALRNSHAAIRAQVLKITSHTSDQRSWINATHESENIGMADTAWHAEDSRRQSGIRFDDRQREVAGVTKEVINAPGRTSGCF